MKLKDLAKTVLESELLSDEDRPAERRHDDPKVKAQVEAIKSDKRYASLDSAQLQRAVEDCMSGDFASLAMLCARPLLKAIIPALLIALLIVIVLFFVKWWVGLIAAVLFIPYAILKIIIEVKRLAGKLGFSVMKIIKEFISDIF